MNDNPIGVFDSGIGGLTVAASIAKQLPFEKLIYFGDTKHLPYGDKSQSFIQELTKNIVEYFLSKNVKAIVIACNTASAFSYNNLRSITPNHIPIINVVDPTIEYLNSDSNIHNIGLIGTKGTISSKVYEKKIYQLNPLKKIIPHSTPLLAPMIEEGFLNNDISHVVLDRYLSFFNNKQIDSLILGCTHYPLIKNEVMAYFNYSIKVIDSADFVAIKLKQFLEDNSLLNLSSIIKSTHLFYVSNYTSLFEQSAKMFFGDDIHLQEVLL